MSSLIVRLDGHVIRKLSLNEPRTYMIGTSRTCDIILAPTRGIAKLHAVIKSVDGCWTAQSVAQEAPLRKIGGECLSVQLQKDSSFFAPPYEFCFLPEPEEKPAPNLFPMVRIEYTETDCDEIELNGTHWVAGRDALREIFLRTAIANRRHFEMTWTEDGFLLKDLGSATGTLLNGQRLNPLQEVPLRNGDRISVAQVNIRFIIKESWQLRSTTRYQAPYQLSS